MYLYAIAACVFAIALSWLLCRCPEPRKFAGPALFIGLPLLLLVFSGLGGGAPFELEFKNSLFLAIALLAFIASTKAVRAGGALSFGKHFSTLNWTDAALIYAFLHFVIHYLAINTIGLLSLDFYTFTTFDFSSYRMLRAESLIDMDTYDVDLIKPSGMRYYVALFVWASSFFTKWAGVESIFMPDPMWFYLRAAHISNFAAMPVALLGVYMAGKRLFSPLAGFTAMLLLGSLTTIFTAPFLIRDDFPVLFFACASLCFYAGFIKEGKKIDLLLSGVFAGLAVLVRLTALPIIIGISLHYAITALMARPFSFTALVRRAIGFSLLYVAPLFAFYVASRPQRFYWPGFFERSRMDFQTYVGWSNLLSEKYAWVMELSFFERFGIILDTIRSLFDKDYLIIGLGLASLAYVVAFRRNLLMATLLVGNIVFMALVTFFPEPLVNRLTYYFLVVGILLVWSVGSAFEAFSQALGKKGFGRALAIIPAIALAIFHVIYSGWGALVKERYAIDLKSVQEGFIRQVPAGSALIINDSMAHFQGAIPNPNIYENYGAGQNSISARYAYPIADYFINPGDSRLYAGPVKRGDCTKNGPDLICKNADSVFNRRATVYDRYLEAGSGGKDLLKPGTTLENWSILINDKLYRDQSMTNAVLGASGLRLQVKKAKDISVGIKESFQPSGVGHFRKRFNYNIRIPYDNDYDLALSADVKPQEIFRLDSPVVFESKDREIHNVFSSDKVAVKASTYYVLEFEISGDVYAVRADVAEFDTKAPQDFMLTGFEPFHISGEPKTYRIYYRTTERAELLAFRLLVEHIEGTIELKDARIYEKGTDRAFDSLNAVYVLPIGMVQGKGGSEDGAPTLHVKYRVAEGSAKGQLNLDVTFESHEGLVIRRSVYHLYSSGMDTPGNTTHLTGSHGEASADIPLWADFVRSSPYKHLPYFVKLSVSAIAPAHGGMDAEISSVELK